MSVRSAGRKPVPQRGEDADGVGGRGEPFFLGEELGSAQGRQVGVDHGRSWFGVVGSEYDVATVRHLQYGLEGTVRAGDRRVAVEPAQLLPDLVVRDPVS